MMITSRRQLILMALLPLHVVKGVDMIPPSDELGDVVLPFEPPPVGGSGCDAEQEECKLTAGIIDDNLNFPTYEIYKRRIINDDAKLALPSDEKLPNPDLSDRLEVIVTDQDGKSFACALVEVVEGKDVELSAGTDGKLAFFSDVEVDDLPARPWTLIPKTPDGTIIGEASTVNIGVELVELIIATAAAQTVEAMDLALVLDTTGSMCDEITFLQDELGAVISNLPNKADRQIDLRFAMIVYKDEGDSYVTQSFDFSEPAKGLSALESEFCEGGGDYPEAVDSAWEAATELSWRSGNVARVALMVGDAPPHRKKIYAAYTAALALRKIGVSIYGMAASDSDDVLEYLFRIAGVLSGGSYMWLTDDSEIGNAKSDAKVACFQVTQMQRLLTRVLRGELDGKRYEAEESEIVREVGNQTAGVCLIDINNPEASLKGTGNSDSGKSGGGGIFVSGPAGGFGGICFPGEATVDVFGKGSISMKDLLIGDKVNTGGNDYSEVYSFGHRNETVIAEYLSIQAMGVDEAFEISSDHMFFIKADGGVKAVPARFVSPGDLAVLASGEVTPVTRVSKVERVGAYAPFTIAGTIVVNGILASSYVSLQDDVFMIGETKTGVSMQWLSHSFQAPHRILCTFAWNACLTESYTSEGLSLWVSTPLSLSLWVVSQNTWVVTALAPMVLLLAMLFRFAEICTLHPLVCVLAYVTFGLLGGKTTWRWRARMYSLCCNSRQNLTNLKK